MQNFLPWNIILREHVAFWMTNLHSKLVQIVSTFDENPFQAIIITIYVLLYTFYSRNWRTKQYSLSWKWSISFESVSHRIWPRQWVRISSNFTRLLNARENMRCSFETVYLKPAAPYLAYHLTSRRRRPPKQILIFDFFLLKISRYIINAERPLRYKLNVYTV